MGSTRAVETALSRAQAHLARAKDAYVPTPAVLAETLTGFPYVYAVLGEPSGHGAGTGPEVLEPSAGRGGLVAAILDADAGARVTAIEPDELRRGAIIATAGANDDNDSRLFARRAAQVVTSAGTFEEWAAANPGRRFDAVVMNSPWSLPGKPRVWVGHVLLAWSMLRPGGRLAAVVPNTLSMPGPDGKRLAALLAAHGGTDVHELPADAIQAGFPARPRVLWLVKPMPATGDRPSWLLTPTTGEPADVKALDVTPGGAERAPVQRYSDWSDGYRPRVARYAGTCHGCARLLWMHDGGAEPPLPWAACSSVDPDEAGMAGPTVGLCMECASRGDRYDAAVAAGAPHWTPAPHAAPTIEDGSASGATVVARTTYGQPVIVAHVTRFDLTAPEPAAVEPAPAPVVASGWGSLEQLELIPAAR